MSIFTIRLKALRKEKKLTQKELAEKIGIKQNSYSDWETGKNEPNLENIVKLAQLLDTTTDDLLGQTIYSKVDVTNFLEDFDVNGLRNFSKDELDKLKWAIMFEITKNKIQALALKNHLILKYELDSSEREILNKVFSEVQAEMSQLFNFR
ncbi:TPA: helix-turn-helix transcriptional regulator [Streptococcus suis]|uniref:helix-turn-helix domain-containing protein n=1 Tax=Streptococcus suis TaxID=1307 RepID=UPI002AA327EA|nr:helix-turn-helix transcriptional regulator [Streptococcus suis]